MTTENTAVLATWLDEPKEPPFIPPKAPYPWRRYFARSLDFSLIAFFYETLLCLLFHINFAERSVPLSANRSSTLPLFSFSNSVTVCSL